ncbi:glutamate--cysteine ligase [Desulfogranum marinum]|uniref:glutamate--cysteine ligase n=1 Tax=Desulfogranum marinum TaxID=453220 RepID=UPI0029C851DD|nr:glutamate--cysteine ligase [Desulfogranum marinum]
MKQSWQNTLESFSRSQYSAALNGIRRGIEKESLRVNGDSSLASTAHPVSLGSPLTHQWITTDYAEALMEFITPVDTNAKKSLGTLADIHRHVYHHIGEELLWPLSMPCTIAAEEDITLARYGNSDVGKTKTIYRQGLKNRYGSMMQSIAGVHYNFSMPDHFWPVWQQIKDDKQPLQDFISESYLALTRNFLRFGWLVPYLFGASPVVDSSFLTHTRSTLPLENIGRSSHYLPHATSLRMSKLGYNTQVQDNLAISYNSLPAFISGLRQATSQPNPVFEKIGVMRHGEYQQLNTNTLQIEGELYAPIRPKRVTRPGERLSDALQTRGVQYVEVRSLDVNPYAETGIDLEQIYFLDIFLTYCLLKESPAFSWQQQCTAKKNMQQVATCGRDVSVILQDGERPRSLKKWGEELFSDLSEVARLLDKPAQSMKYQKALHHQHQKLKDPAKTPSARILKDMAEQKLEINELALNLAKKHRHTLLKTNYTQVRSCEFAREALVSRSKQRELEKSKPANINDYLRLTLDVFPPAPKPEKVLRGQYCHIPPRLCPNKASHESTCCA